MSEQALQTKEKEKEITLTCREAHLLLNTINKDTKGDQLSKEQRASIHHYWKCDDCLKKGLASIVSYDMDCKEALLVWSKLDHWRNIHGTVGNSLETLRHCISFEHIFGKHLHQVNEDGRRFLSCHSQWWIGRFDNCEEVPCGKLYQMHDINFTYSREASEDTIPFLLKVFQEEKWPLADLLAVQKELLLEATGIGEKHKFYAAFENSLSVLVSIAFDDSSVKTESFKKLLFSHEDLLLDIARGEVGMWSMNSGVIAKNLSALNSVILGMKPMPENT